MPPYNNNPFANLTPVVKNLLIINGIFFLARFLFSQFMHIDLDMHLAAFYPASSSFRAWQIFTYMFMHGGIAHIFSNMLWLFFVGPILEYTFGPQRFLIYYFITGIGALFFQYVVQAIQLHQITGSFFANDDMINMLPTLHAQKAYDIMHDPILGASGAIFGLLIGIFLLFPEMKVYLYFIVPLKIKYLVPIYVLWEVYSSINPGANDNVAHLAHVGGAIVGFILIKIWGYHKQDNFF